MSKKEIFDTTISCLIFRFAMIGFMVAIIYLISDYNNEPNYGDNPAKQEYKREIVLRDNICKYSDDIVSIEGCNIVRDYLDYREDLSVCSAKHYDCIERYDALCEHCGGQMINDECMFLVD